MIDGDDKYHVLRWFSNIGTLFFHWIAGAAITKSPLSYARKKSMVPTKADERVKMKSPGYVVAGTSDNKAYSGTKVFESEAHARDYMKKTIFQNPELAEEIHVIPEFEASL